MKQILREQRREEGIVDERYTKEIIEIYDKEDNTIEMKSRY
jgi:hypothetical protein